MISIEEGIQLIQETVRPLSTETVSLDQALNRILAKDVRANLFIPPFNRSAMDGYACQSNDLPGSLEVVGEVAAGTVFDRSLLPGQCVRIMTGAPVPNGADTVIMQEDVLREGKHIHCQKQPTKNNISDKGEDIKPGDLVIPGGTFLDARRLGLLAAVGVWEIEVSLLPKIGIMATGSELVEPGCEALEGQIYNSNGHQLGNRLKEMGIIASNYGIAEDKFEPLLESIRSAIREQDVLFITGGVSVGDYDYVPAILKELDFEFHFTKLAAKPGKHTLFASKGRKYVLGLPGNPVSTYVQFLVCGMPLLHALMHSVYSPLRIRMHLGYNFTRKNGNRFELVPVNINNKGVVEEIGYHGSAHFHAVAFANALLEIPIGVTSLSENEFVYVRPI
jgi:molybdopterin molybdotransferase